MGILQNIKENEAKMARTQKNKVTEYHLGQLKAKIAKLRTQLLEAPKGSSGVGEGFEVTKFGHGRVALIGFPSVEKYTLPTMLTGTHSEVPSYEFTTLTCIPGIIHYNDLIDVIEGNRKYMKCIYVYNKIDIVGIDDVDRLALQPNDVVINCNMKLNLDRLLAKMWEAMGLVRVYTKPQGQQPDFTNHVVLSTDRGGCTVKKFCNLIHRSLVKDVKYVLVWGTSARHSPQYCGLAQMLDDEDVVHIVKKKKKEVGGGRGRFKSHSNAPSRISDREKKAPLKT